MRSLTPQDNRLARKFTMKNNQKDEYFHSSSYGSAQNSGNIGTASVGLTMEERKAIESKRQFVAKYNESNLFESTFSVRHAKKFDPNATANVPQSSIPHNRENTMGDADGNVRTSFGRTAGNKENVIGIGGNNTVKRHESSVKNSTSTGQPQAQVRNDSGAAAPRLSSSPLSSPTSTHVPPRPSPASNLRPSFKPTFR